MGQYEVVSETRQDFSFEDQNSVTLVSTPVLLESSKNSWSADRGKEYEGYLAYVVDQNGKVIGVKGSRKIFEDNVDKFKAATKGTKFDKDMVLLNPPKSSSQTPKGKGKKKQ